MQRSSDPRPSYLSLQPINGIAHASVSAAPLDPPFNESPPRLYDVFMAYSHGADGEGAARLQRGLERVDPSYWRTPPPLRVFREWPPLRVFRDKKDLPTSPRLWRSICDAIDGAQWLVLLASPASANSCWVGQEIRRWLATNSSDRILIVCTDGEWHWDRATGDFDFERSSAINPALKGAFPEEPLITDMSWAEAGARLSLRNGRFLDVVADIAATVTNTPKRRLVRRQRMVTRVETAFFVVAAAAAITLAVNGIRLLAQCRRRGPT